MMKRLSISVRDLAVDYELFDDRRAALRDRVIKQQGPGRRVIPALRGISFDVKEGEAVGVVGSNGAGKSTLLAALAGLLPPTKGEILVAEEPKLLGVGATLLPAATGWRNIEIGCLAIGMRRNELQERLSEIGEFTELGSALDRPMRTYSSGMRARLTFSIATSMRPRILLIDEALAVGDQAFKRKSQDRMAEIVSSAGTLILVSHALKEVESQCSRTLWIEAGSLVADGPTHEILAAYRNGSKPSTEPRPSRVSRSHPPLK